MDPADDEHDGSPSLRDRLAVALTAAILAMPLAYLLWLSLSTMDVPAIPAANAAGVVVAAIAVFALVRPQAMPEAVLRLVEAIRWSGRGR